MPTGLLKSRATQIAISALILLSIWWGFLNLTGASGLPTYIFGMIYGPFMSLFGACIGFSSAGKWGGTKSIIGKAIIMLSFGLLAQAFGQISFSVYNIFLNVEVPYPSVADIGYFGNIPLYAYGALLLAQASGGKVKLKAFFSQFQAVLIPLAMLVVSYILFLRGYEFDWSQPLKTLLDFGYPLGQALYVSLAISAYSLSRRVLGGVMRKAILILIAAFVLQYIADFNFLYQSSNGTWLNAGYGDYLYLIAYFVMTLGMIQLKNIADSLSKR